MTENIAGLAFPTKRIANELCKISNRLDGDDAEWVKKAAERLATLQSICRPSLVVKKGGTFSASVTTDDEGFEKTFFNVLIPFDEAIEFVRNRFARKGISIRKIEIKRDDETREYEPYSEDDTRFS